MFHFRSLFLKAKSYKLKASSGFTLIELLVVIAIIGLLASVVFASLNTARQRGRDARRLSDVREMVKSFAVETGSTSIALTGCIGADAKVSTCTGPGTIANFSSYKDPSSPSGACVTGGSAVCDYSISKADGSAGAATDNYQICFYLEGASGSVAAGLNKVTSEGTITAGCS